jgi:hypothetical protein
LPQLLNILQAEHSVRCQPSSIRFSVKSQASPMVPQLSNVSSEHETRGRSYQMGKIEKKVLRERYQDLFKGE